MVWLSVLKVLLSESVASEIPMLRRRLLQPRRDGQGQCFKLINHGATLVGSLNYGMLLLRRERDHAAVLLQYFRANSSIAQCFKLFCGLDISKILLVDIRLADEQSIVLHKGIATCCHLVYLSRW